MHSVTCYALHAYVEIIQLPKSVYAAVLHMLAVPLHGCVVVTTITPAIIRDFAVRPHVLLQLLTQLCQLQANNVRYSVCLSIGIQHWQECVPTSTVIPGLYCFCVTALHSGNNAAYPERCTKKGEVHLCIWA